MEAQSAPSDPSRRAAGGSGVSVEGRHAGWINGLF